MTNREYYKEQILDIACKGGSIAMNKDTHKICSCFDVECDKCFFESREQVCREKIKAWAEEEYVPYVDWSKVEVDTPIFVSNYKFTAENKGTKRHFAKYENGKVYVFENGQTSWTSDTVMDWPHARLATEEEFKKERNENE